MRRPRPPRGCRAIGKKKFPTVGNILHIKCMYFFSLTSRFVPHSRQHTSLVSLKQDSPSCFKSQHPQPFMEPADSLTLLKELITHRYSEPVERSLYLKTQLVSYIEKWKYKTEILWYFVNFLLGYWLYDLRIGVRFRQGTILCVLGHVYTESGFNPVGSGGYLRGDTICS
jgi:hypothetical protein